MALARFGIINGRKVPVSEIPTVEAPKLDSFSKKALAKMGFQGIAERTLTGARLTDGDINKLLEKAGVPVLMKLVRLLTEGRCIQAAPLRKGSSCDFYKFIESIDDLITEEWCDHLLNQGVYRLEVPLKYDAVKMLLKNGLEVDLISNFDNYTSRNDMLHEFLSLAELTSNYSGIRSWMPVLTRKSTLYPEQATRDFQILRFIGVGKLVCRNSYAIRVSGSLLSREASPIAKFAGCSEVVDYSPVDPSDGEIFIRTFGFDKTGNSPVRK
jgi:hypothetical protein